MSDIEQVVNAFQQNGPTAAVAVAGLWAGKRVMGPALDAIGVKFGTYTTSQLDNLAKIFTKAEGTNVDASGSPHPRVVNRVLNDASLYDDDVMQTYTAGLIAGSRNDDGSDDRPIYYLGLIDSLTAGQLTLFHCLYSAAVRVGPPEGRRAIDPSALHVAVHIEQIGAAMTTLGPAGARLSADDPLLASPITALHTAGLMRDDGTDKLDGTHPLVTYWISRAGMLLFDWAYGFEDEDLHAFYERDRSNIDLPTLNLDTARLV